MSIRSELLNRSTEGRLVVFKAVPQSRLIFLTKQVDERLSKLAPNDDAYLAIQELKADLAYISQGNQVVIGSKRHKTCHFKELTVKPPAVWTISSRAPKPGMRLFGMFAAQDVFIGTTLYERQKLGGKKSPTWKEAIRTCRAEWRNLFGNYAPFAGGFDEYFSQNYTDARDLESG